jgi:16S rRNA (guanine527-N7)-methyltransferase
MALERYVELLHLWQRTTHLVSPHTLSTLWERHVFDSWSFVRALAPLPVETLVDLGSGGGFPGIVLGIACLENGRGHVHLIESHRRKAAFLESVALALNLPVSVHAERAESLPAGLKGQVDVVTARALAPLETLLPWAHPYLAPAGVCFFAKGETVDSELQRAGKHWTFHEEREPSLSDSQGVLLKLSALQPRL